MKKIVLILTLLISTFGIAQDNPAYKTAKLYFKNGETLNGIGKIGNKKIKFKTHSNSREIIQYTPDDIYGFDLLINRKIIKYRYRYLKEKSDKPILLELTIQGKVSLYKNVKRSNILTGFLLNSGNSNKNGNFNNIYGANLDKVSDFYVGHENESLVIFLSTEYGSFKGNGPTMEYFKDCPSLYAKIKSRFFKISEMDEIVEYYNENCNSD